MQNQKKTKLDTSEEKLLKEVNQIVQLSPESIGTKFVLFIQLVGNSILSLLTRIVYIKIVRVVEIVKGDKNKKPHKIIKQYSKIEFFPRETTGNNDLLPKDFFMKKEVEKADKGR